MTGGTIRTYGRGIENKQVFMEENTASTEALVLAYESDKSIEKKSAELRSELEKMKLLLRILYPLDPSTLPTGDPEVNFQEFCKHVNNVRSLKLEIAGEKARASLIASAGSEAKRYSNVSEIITAAFGDTIEINKMLQPIAKRLSENPEESKRGPSYYTKDTENGFVTINLGQIQADIFQLKEMENSILIPEKKAVLGKFIAALESIRDADPVTNKSNILGRAVMDAKGQRDYKPLRLIGAIGGLVVTMIGIGVGIRSKDKKIPAATFLWAGILGLSLFPDFLQEKGMGIIKDFMAFNDPKVQGFLAKHKIEGKGGKDAVAELFKLGKNGYNKVVAMLKGTKPITEEMIINIGIKKEETLFALLKNMKNDDRRLFFTLFSPYMDEKTAGHGIPRTVLAYIEKHKEGREYVARSVHGTGEESLDDITPLPPRHG